MTRALTADEITAALKRFGVVYHETPGWRIRKNGSGWGDVAGFMWHHTGDDAPDNVDMRIVTHGHAGLPGPLCQFGLRDDGTVDLIAAGAANHAGGGDPHVLTAVRQQSYGSRPQVPRYAHGQAGSVSGNGAFYGVETYYVGVPDPRAARTMPRLAAAIIDALDRVDNSSRKWDAKRAIGHKEWQRGKIDPMGVDCAAMRGLVQKLLTPVKAPAVAPVLKPPAKPVVVPPKAVVKPPVKPAVKPAVKPPVKPAVRPVLKRTLTVGMSGGDVRAVQGKLGIKADGAFGPGTRAAVLAFQRRYWPHDAAAQDGKVGPATRKALGL